MSVSLMLSICIRDVPGINLGSDTNYRDRWLRGFPQSFRLIQKKFQVSTASFPIQASLNDQPMK
jgi:hypothetical protein